MTIDEARKKIAALTDQCDPSLTNAFRLAKVVKFLFDNLAAREMLDREAWEGMELDKFAGEGPRVDGLEVPSSSTPDKMRNSSRNS